MVASYRLEGQPQRARQEYEKALAMPNLDANFKPLIQKELDELK